MGGNTSRERDYNMVRLLNKFVDIKKTLVKKISKRKTAKPKKKVAKNKA
jgi:hypothetical protein